MVLDNTRRISSLGRPSAFSLALATTIACVISGACRLIAQAAFADQAELDGVAFLAAVYWAVSAIGFFSLRLSTKRSEVPTVEAAGRERWPHRCGDRLDSVVGPLGPAEGARLTADRAQASPEGDLLHA